MADEVHAGDGQAEPAGESIHLPGPTFLPVVLAGGLTLLVSGVVISPIMVVLGLAISLVAIVRWIRDTRREMAELPLEH